MSSQTPQPDRPGGPPDVESAAEHCLLEDLRVVFDRRSTTTATEGSGPDDLVGQQIDHYRIRRLLGEGGMARVYEALDENNGKTVAVKALKPAYRGDQSMSARFEREARSMARIEHEHVVRVLDFPAHGSARAIVMEYVSGGSLRDRLIAARSTRRPVPIDEGVNLIRQAASGCAAAHEMGMIHRDIKPSNLLIDERNRIKVADFGTIMVVEGTTWLTGVGQQIGTPGYMSPEQCRGEKVSPSSDVYSLGISLYELLTGQLPFEVEDSSPFAIMLKHISEPPPDPHKLREEIPPALAAVILQSLSKLPQDRYPTAAEFAQALVDYPQQTVEDPDVTHEHGLRVDVAAVRKQLLLLPQRAIVCWACRCARRVQHLMEPDPHVERALAMAEAMVKDPAQSESPHSVSMALSKIRNLRAASLKAAYTESTRQGTPAGTEAAKAAAAAAASAAALCVADTAADAAFAARSAIAALKMARVSVRPFWEAALQDYHTLVKAKLGREGTVGQPIPANLFKD